MNLLSFIYNQKRYFVRFVCVFKGELENDFVFEYELTLPDLTQCRIKANVTCGHRRKHHNIRAYGHDLLLLRKAVAVVAKYDHREFWLCMKRSNISVSMALSALRIIG